jgi:hypothetical protein
MHAVASGLVSGDLARVAAELVALRYCRRFMDEVALHDDSVAEGAAPAAEMRGP